jgi:hypothetical protein
MLLSLLLLLGFEMFIFIELQSCSTPAVFGVSALQLQMEEKRFYHYLTL